MSCVRTRQMMDAWLDGELDPSTSDEISHHVGQCAECVALKNQREQLRATLQAAAPRYAAPPALRSAVMSQLQAAQQPPVARVRPTARGPSWWQAMAMAAAASIVTALVTWGALSRLSAPSDEQVAFANQDRRPVREQLVARHVASLAAPSLIEVPSSDSHVIKPWFQGKIDFAPVVRDLSAQGFVLLGARMERVSGQRAVAVVYKIREHPINLFAWPDTSGRDSAVELATVRGFSMGSWTAGGLNFAAVSDVDAHDLERFVASLQLSR